MPYGQNFALGMQRLLNANQRFMRGAFPFFLRMKNFTDTQQAVWSQLGFTLTPAAGLAGVVDVLITPPPTATFISVHNIGMSEGKLRFGARRIRVSQAFVTAQMQTQGLTDQNLVWRQPSIVGLVSENLLFSIEDIRHFEVAGATVYWDLTCNANEIR